MLDKTYGGTCGKALNKRHHFRNIARHIMNKRQGLTDKQKILAIYAAREALTVALEATGEGRLLLKEGLPLSVESLVTMEASVQENTEKVFAAYVLGQSSGYSENDLNAMLVPEILAVAANLDIPRRTKMTKAQLVDAIIATQ